MAPMVRRTRTGAQCTALGATRSRARDAARQFRATGAPVTASPAWPCSCLAVARHREVAMRQAMWSGGLALVGAFLASSMTAKSQGHILHVSATDPTCQGRAPCYRTIQGAVTAAGAGDLVVVVARVYSDQVSIVAQDGAA